MEKHIRLCEVSGETTITIDAAIKDNGDLLISGQDVGGAPSEVFGDNDYEYWLKVPYEYKDDVLLIVLEKPYSGNAKVVSELKEFQISVGIPCKFDRWV